MSSYYNPSKRLSEYAAALLSPYIKLENKGEQRRDHHDQNAAPSLSVGLWSGNVELKNVEIRPEAIEQFLNSRDEGDENGNDDGDFRMTARIKWKLRRGRVDSVKIQIPWKSLLVGSAYSSTKREIYPGRGNNKATRRIQGDGEEDEPECASVCTTIHIEGVTLLLGYEIIHRNPLLNSMQHQHQKYESSVSSPEGDEKSSDEDHLRVKIRQEKNRILQIAERRLQMGLDPFPPFLMEELHSLVRSSIQSESLLSSSIKKSIPSSQPSQPTTNDESLSFLATNTYDTTSARTTNAYLSRMENYFSSSIKSLLWRVFESLSLSVTHVQLSFVGDSHYDKDHRALLRRETAAKAGGKSTDQKQHPQQQQQNNTHSKERDSKRDFQHRGGRTNDYPSPRRLHRNASRAEKEHREEETVDHSRDSDHQGKAVDEDSAIWSREGKVELGVTLDRLYVRPGPLPARANGDYQSGSVALKLIQFIRAGVFIRRIHPQIFGDGGGQYDDIKETDVEGHVGRNLMWKDTNKDDFVLIPKTIGASCKVYRDVSESHGVEATSSSLPQIEREFLIENYDDASSIGASLSSRGTETTGRRGKRDKRQRTVDSDIRDPLQSCKRTGHSVISSTTPSTETSVTRRFTRTESSKDSISSALRLEVNMEMGHIQSSLSPRQVFLIHSLSSSIARMKRGRPKTTIRDAWAHDKVLMERMVEEGQSVMAWEDRIYREFPLMRLHQRQSPRTLPEVISSWWKYAYLNVVNEIRQQRRLLGRYTCDRANTAFSINSCILSRPSFDSQSKIRREYIDLYMSAYSSIEHVVDKTGAFDTSLLLAKLEDKLSVERLLLLKNVARAASVRRAQTQDHSSPAENYYNFFSESQSMNARNWSIKKSQRNNSAGNGSSLPQKIDGENVPVPSLQFPEVDASLVAEKHDAGSQATRDSTATQVSETFSRDALSFSGNLSISGFSLALCDFFDGNTEVETLAGIVDQYHHSYIADDVSTLTGFSDDESKAAKQKSIEDTFDPLIQFWPTSRHGFHCKPIMLIHVAGILLSTRRRKNDVFQPTQLINTFSVGGISLQMGCVSPQQIFFRLGHIPCGSNPSDHSKGVSGRCSSLSSSIVVGPTEIIVDWAWVEKILRFGLKVKDIKPIRVTAELENEDLLIRSFSTSDRKRIGRHSFQARFDALSLTIPLHNAITDDASEQQYLIAAANHFHVKTINPHDSYSNDPGSIIDPTPESGKTSNLFLPSNEDLLFDLDSLDAVIETHKKKHAEIQRHSIRLLRCPISIQVQYSGAGARPLLLEQSHHYCCQSYDVRSQTIQLLVSESRLRALLKTMDIVRMTLSNVRAPKLPEAVLRRTKSVMNEYVFAEWKASIESLGIHVIPDNYEESPDDFFGRRLLEDAIASFVCHLSYLDFDHPSQVAIDCISMVFIERCRALGIAEDEVRELLHAARANFNSEASAKSVSHPRDDAEEKLGGQWAVNRNRNINRHLDAPLALSEAFDQVVKNSTRMTITEFGGGLSAESKCDLSMFAESLVISRSFLHGGSTSQITVKSLKIQNQQINLLKICQQSSDSEPSQPTAVPDQTDSALAMIVRNRNDASRGYTQDIYIEAGRIVSIFSPEAYLEASKACLTLFDVVSEAKRVHHHERPVRDMIVNGCVSSLILVLTDNFVPFLECRFQDMTFEKSAIESQISTHTSFHAGAIFIDCVSQTSYPCLLSTYTSKNGEDNELSPAFSIYLNIPPISTSSPSELFIELNGVRIVLLRRILNEILQYVSSPNYGIGFILYRFETKASTAPPELKLSIHNSSIVLPRDSNSVDMVGIEVEEISLAREQVSETWSIEEYSFSNDTVAQSSGKFGRTSSSADIFFDCIDAHTTSGLNFTPPETRIKRYSVQVKGGNVFTALNPCHVSSSDINMPAFTANVLSTGRAAHHKRPFAVGGKIAKTLKEDLVSRVWEKVNEAQVNLRFTVDHAPMFRLLVEDVGDCNSRGTHFAMRMSQLYLVMSIWYSNMKELPILFPYDSDFVEKSSTDPGPPSDWPEYGTSEFVSRLKQCASTGKGAFEMALCFKNLTWRCFYDHPDYFAAVPPSMSLMQSVGIEPEGVHVNNFISIAFKNAVCSIKSDEENLLRIGVGAASIEINDGRQQQTEANLVKMLRAEGDLSQPTIVDLNWGLDCGRHTLLDAGLPMPFQVTIFMTPDLNCLINLGADFAEANLADLTPIWILLDYFGLFFKKSEYGHPAFEAELIYLISLGDASFESSELDDNSLNLDFRLWMIMPHVIIPSSTELYVMFEAAGLYYRYKSFGQNYSSQEIVAKDIGIVVLGEYTSPSICRGLRQVSGSLSSCGVQTLIEDMSFSLRYDFNAKTNAAVPYFKVVLRLPLYPKHFDRPKDGIECSSIDAQPFCVPPPLVCKPFVVPSRTMGDQETTIYFSYEYMTLLLDLMTSFVGPRQQINSFNDETARNYELQPENCFSVIAHVERVKCVISDPVMGMHRPFLSVCLPSLLLTASQLQIHNGPETEIEKLTGDTDGYAKDLQASMEVTIFIEHFKLGLTRNWEDFVEPFKCLVLYERSASRGKGITFNADCPLHVNLSSALIETMDDAIKTYELFRAGRITQQHNMRILNGIDIRTSSLEDERGRDVTVLHRFAEHLEGNGRIAFSVENCTGELLRVHTHSPLETEISSCQITVVYLNHMHLMPLSFPATETVIKNLENVEVPFKGDQNVSSFRQKLKNVASHEIDFQIPGFRWVRAVSFDKTGKHFLQVIPRSPVVETKIADDWRLKNALHVLAEIISVNGGRRLSITSPFEVINKTDHPIILATDPDPRHAPVLTLNGDFDSAGFYHGCSHENGFSVSKINPGETHNISFLLIESALRMNGNHLGSLWIRPDQSSKDDFKDVLLDPNSSALDESIIAFPLRPIQLAKMLHESSVIFKDSNSDPAIANQVASGIEISCPVYNKSDHIPISRPFCYVVEVKRSPFVRSKSVKTNAANIGDGISPARIGKGFAKNIFSKITTPEKADVHGPIAYSLVIHPPLIIENLLPERGRFEIIHAISRNVLWWGSLKAGERVSVFTVGLDAPLLLLVNLGYCRTAVGEGALVHHGGGDGLFKPWNAFQGAMKTSRDRVKRTLNTIAESKDNRGAQRIAKIKARQTKRQKDSGGRRVNYIGFKENERVENSADGFLRRGNGYGLEDIATELSVIDSLGQRLTLNIDNVLGSGGQRRITLFSPFWIVNTTEHSLRYKQEKALSFVSGTVLSKAMDGSKPVDEGHRSHLHIDEYEGLVTASKLDSLTTIFSGRPGAMSMLKCNTNCTAEPALLAALISNDLPLRVLSKLAFMFNFHDVLSLGGLPRLCLQLADTQQERSPYTSAWSSAFGLESVGVTQIVSMHCKDGRGLEVSVSVSVAPGRLGSFTKIVRICPRYVVVNQLPFPIRLWQDSSILHPNVTRDDSSANVRESQNWIFANSDKNNTINQYERLFGLRTVIDGGKESSMSAQTNAHHDACFIATVRSSELAAFHLPDTRLERSLRVDFGPSWYLSPSFAVDTPGELMLSLSRVRDLRMLNHVSSRGAPVYTITLPPTDTNDWSGELGVFFETEWGKDRTLIVKGIREGSYASYYTDIAVGDEMIKIDSTPVKNLTFDDAMKFMKARLYASKQASERTNSSATKSLPLQLMVNKTKKRIQRGAYESESNDNVVTLTFLTQEERLRRLRRAAVGTTAGMRIARESSVAVQKIDHATMPEQGNTSKELLVDMKFLFQSVFVFLRRPITADPPYRIVNRSLHWRIYYRQKGCDSHPWQCLSPGESSAYTWEEPLKAKKLSVRVGVGEWIDSDFGRQHPTTTATSGRIGNSKGRKYEHPNFSFQFFKNEELGYFGGVKTIKLEEIGHNDTLPCPPRGDKGLVPSHNKKEHSLSCEVDSEGSTRVLVISDQIIGTHQDSNEDETLVRCHLERIGKEISDEERRRAKVDELSKTVARTYRVAFPADPDVDSQSSSHYKADDPPCSLTATDAQAIETELQELMDHDEGLSITVRNQIVIEVMEATGLRSSDLNGLSNPFVQVKLISTNKKSHFGSFSNNTIRSTYVVEKTLSPQWCYQSFVFDVPEKASYDPKETRRYSLQCVIKSKDKLTGSKFLGQAHVHLRNLKDQRENVGWYPLMGKLGQSGIGKDPLDRICGSIRLRVQWIYDIPGLMEYYLLCADRRLGTLHSSREGMTRQLKALQDKAQQEKELRESLSIASVPALAALHKKKNIRSSFEYRSDGSIPTKEEASSHGGSGVIMGVKSFIGKSKGASKDEPKKIAETPDISENMLHHESSRSPIDFNDTSDYRVFSTDDVIAASLPRSHTLINDNPSAEASTTSSILLASHTANSSKNTSQWQMRRHRPDKTTGGFAHPFYPSWNIARAFINKKDTAKHKRSNISSSPVHLKEKGDNAKMAEVLKLPPSAPRLIAEREKIYAYALISSRESFSKAARRSLNSIFNPGGVLTIRPITALNLPDSFTGMFVKLRYDDKVQSTISVDGKVVPVWSNDNDFYRGSSTTMKSRPTSHIQRRGSTPQDAVQDFDDVAEIFNPTRAGGTRQCDINIQISPFETSKSLRLSVFGESRGLNVEIGVLDIPLGAALECTMDQPAYTRWFPLKTPAEAVPIEGDMNRSCRPFESEKINDSMFAEYFAPCIKLALMFQPNSMETDSDYVAGADQYLYVRVDQISAALIDSSRTRELVSFSARDADVRYSVTSAKTRLAVAVGHIQLDHQSFGTNAQVPVLLSPTPVKFPQPTVQFLAWKDNIRSKLDMDSYEYVAIQVQEMDLKIEEVLLYDVWKFYLDVAKTREARASCWRHNVSPVNFSSDAFDVGQSIDPIEIARVFLTQDKKTKRKKIYVKELILGFFKVNLSYFKSTRMSRGGLDSNEEMSANVDSLELLPFRIPLSNEQQGRPSSAADDAYIQWSENFDSGFEERIPFASMISAVFPRISDAPISFNERIIYHVYENEGDIWKSLRSFYSSESLKQIYKIVGSLDFVGNPTMVLTSFRTGLRDFVLQPSRELKHITKNPSRVGVGVLKGTLSLVSNSASGIFGFASNLGATVGHTATQLTLDEDFQRLHSEQKAAQQLHYDRWKKKGFGHFTLMVSRPVSDIVFGVISASTGILLEPYRGAKQGGLVGFTKGTAIGIIGVVVKPVVGFSDAFAHIMESIHDIAKSVNLLELKSKSIERFRLPNIFGPRKMLLPFNAVDSKSAQLLLAHPLEKKAKKGEEVIVASEALHRGNGLEHYVVVTQLRVVLFKLKVVDGQGFVTANLVWQVKLLDTGARITSSLGNRGHNGYILCISRSSLRKQDRDNFDDPSQHNSYRRGSLQTINEDSHNQSENFLINRDEKKSYPGTPKSLYPLGSSTVRLGNMRPFPTAEGADVNRFVVEGDLNHRSQLSRIHNAICCICGDFDAIKREKYHDGNEGVTSFGAYIFEPKTVENRAQCPLYSSPEDTVWKFEPSLPSNVTSNMSRFSSPSWLVGCVMAESSSHPRLKSPLDADNSSDVSGPQMISLPEKNDVRKYDVVADENFFLHSQIDSDSIGMESGESDGYVDEQSDREQDSFVELFGTFPFLTMPNPTECKVDELLSASVEANSLFSEKEIKSDLVERVRRVEAMIERLVGHESSNDVTMARAKSQRAQNDSNPLDELCGFNDFDAAPISPLSYDSHVEVRALLKEIEDLKQQLAEKNATKSSES